MKIYLDFDGTITIHTYPDIGILNSGCFEVIRKLQDANLTACEAPVSV